MRSFLIAGILLASSLALGQQRYDHRGSLGLTVAAGGEVLTAVSITASGERGFRIPLEVGGTLSISSVGRGEIRGQRDNNLSGPGP